MLTAAQSTDSDERPRTSDLGLKVGIFSPGPLDAITDVAGVEVGQEHEYTSGSPGIAR